MDKYPLMRFVGRYFRGIARGFCWKGLWGGGYICGYVDSKDGSFSGTCLLNHRELKLDGAKGDFADPI